MSKVKFQKVKRTIDNIKENLDVLMLQGTGYYEIKDRYKLSISEIERSVGPHTLKDELDRFTSVGKIKIEENHGGVRFLTDIYYIINIDEFNKEFEELLHLC